MSQTFSAPFPSAAGGGQPLRAARHCPYASFDWTFPRQPRKDVALSGRRDGPPGPCSGGRNVLRRRLIGDTGCAKAPAKWPRSAQLRTVTAFQARGKTQSRPWRRAVTAPLALACLAMAALPQLSGVFKLSRPSLEAATPVVVFRELKSLKRFVRLIRRRGLWFERSSSFFPLVWRVGGCG